MSGVSFKAGNLQTRVEVPCEDEEPPKLVDYYDVTEDRGLFYKQLLYRIQQQMQVQVAAAAAAAAVGAAVRVPVPVPVPAAAVIVAAVVARSKGWYIHDVDLCVHCIWTLSSRAFSKMKVMWKSSCGPWALSVNGSKRSAAHSWSHAFLDACARRSLEEKPACTKGI